MSVLVVPDPFGVGTMYVESLASLVKRIAKLYQVRTTRVLRLVLAGVGNGDQVRAYNKVSSWLGGATLSNSLVEGIQAWSGKDLGETALAKQRSIVGSARSLLAERPRVCPACADGRNGSDYEMLCHQMKYVSHCPLHGCLLNESCLACGKFLSCYQWLARGARCTYCKSDFAGQYREETRVSHFASWCEAQALEFVEYTTSLEFDADLSDWMIRFKSGMAKLAKSTMEGYSRREREFIRDDCNGMSFAQLLKVASMQACGLVELVRAPEEMLSPRLPVAGGVPASRFKRVVIDPGLFEQVEKRLEELLATEEGVKLPTKRAVFRELGVECNRVWRMYPRLSAAYSAELIRRRYHGGRVALGRAVLEARMLLEVVVHFEVYSSRSVLEAAIRDECGVSRSIACRAIQMALSELSDDLRTCHDVNRSRASVSSSELRDLRTAYVGSRLPRALA